MSGSSGIDRTARGAVKHTEPPANDGSRSGTLTAEQHLQASRDAKRQATAAARAALIGATLHRIENDAGRAVYVLTRWNHTREFDEIQVVERFLDLMGAPA